MAQHRLLPGGLRKMTSDFESIQVELPYGRMLTLGQLMASWATRVSRVAEEMPAPVVLSTWGAHDYFAALAVRDFLQAGAAQLNAEQLVELEERVGPTDGLLRRITEPDEKGLVVRFGEVAPSRQHWWWARLPMTGLIREELEAWLSNAESPEPGEPPWV